jgi:hypothetical protein
MPYNAYPAVSSMVATCLRNLLAMAVVNTGSQPESLVASVASSVPTVFWVWALGGEVVEIADALALPEVEA